MQHQTVPQTSTDQPEAWYFTFGSGQQYDGMYVVIPGSYDTARDEMLRHFGNAWSFQYGSAERAGTEEFGLIELTRAEWPPTMVNRAINALSAFGVTTEREAGQLLPMWLHFGEMTLDDRNAVYRHYRTDANPSTTEPANPDRRCHRCGATSGLKMLHRNPLTLADREWECYEDCTGGAR